ncbi:MAG: K(+)-transporting ATPase subunit F [Alicyclobacillus macrosporangiidus]|nr:K(+)-transporting ATPase subunit F [Alicyclobacillus macrosporangiidus]
MLSQEGSMMWVLLVIAVVLMAYLTYVIFNPEKF